MASSPNYDYSTNHAFKVKICPRCNKREVKGDFTICWSCMTRESMRKSYEQGHREGYEEGYQAARAKLHSLADNDDLDKSMVRRLLQLCHPDKHENSNASTKATQWLLEMLRKM